MTIYNEKLEEGLKKIEDREAKICVVGVGTIGLPLATFLANAGFHVTGLDVNKERVRQINSASVVFEYGNTLKKVVKEKKLRATSEPAEAIGNASVVFVCVPTPLNKENAIDLSKLEAATEAISKNLKQGALIIYESSVSIGATSQLGKKIEEKTGLKIGRDIGLAYCPERYNPTLPQEHLAHVHYNNENNETEIYTLDKVGRVIGGADEKSLKLGKAIYKTFIKPEVKELSCIEAAEATKLLENIFRDVNIALVNELAKIYSVFGLDIYEIVDAAKTKPFAFLAHYPGPGVGGECIPVDTWYLIKQAEAKGLETKLMKSAREVNDSMPSYMVKLLEQKLKKHGLALSNANITLLGLSYKKNINDTRLSPTFAIMKILKAKNAKFKVCDPVAIADQNPDYTLVPIEEAFRNSDAILLITDHDVFRTINLEEARKEMRTPVIVDGRKFFEKEKAKKLGFDYTHLAGENR